MAWIDKKDRITIYRRLGFSYDRHSQSLSSLVAAEIKQAYPNPRSPFNKQMEEIGSRPGLCSKCYFGSTLPDPTLKHNCFKHILHRIACIGEGGIFHE